jgi:hypothetical protein
VSLFSFITTQVQSNQIAQAAIMAGPATALAYSAKALPLKLLRGAKKLVSVDVRFNSDMADFEAVLRFVTNNVVKDAFSRNFVYTTESKWDTEDYEMVHKHHGLTAGYGTHLGFFNRHPVLVDRFLDDGNNTEKFKEHLVVTFFTRSKRVVREFSTEVAKAAGNNIESFESVPVHVNGGNYWDRMGKLPLRRMNTVLTSDNAGEKLVASIREFEGRKEEDHRLGLPHHFGAMLHSEPGCGKSSLIHAVASELERSIYYLNMGSLEKDRDLLNLLNGRNDWSRILLAIEDFDAAGVDVSKRTDDEPDTIECDEGVVVLPQPAKPAKKSPITLSALLNVLDGILCPDGLVVIATTNHHDKLDPAITRPGRFDQTFRLGKLNYRGFVQMCELFGKRPSDFPQIGEDVLMTGAEMRAVIMGASA